MQVMSTPSTIMMRKDVYPKELHKE